MSIRWLLFPGKITGAEFERLAAQHGVQVYAAEHFVVGNSCPERAVRVSVAVPETIEELEQGLIILRSLPYKLCYCMFFRVCYDERKILFRIIFILLEEVVMLFGYRNV